MVAVARTSPEERREKAEQLREIPEKKPKADNTKRWQQAYTAIDKSYEDMKAPKRADEMSDAKEWALRMREKGVAFSTSPRSRLRM